MIDYTQMSTILHSCSHSKWTIQWPNSQLLVPSATTIHQQSYLRFWSSYPLPRSTVCVVSIIGSQEHNVLLPSPFQPHSMMKLLDPLVLLVRWACILHHMTAEVLAELKPVCRSEAYIWAHKRSMSDCTQMSTILHRCSHTKWTVPGLFSSRVIAAALPAFDGAPPGHGLVILVIGSQEHNVLLMASVALWWRLKVSSFAQRKPWVLPSPSQPHSMMKFSDLLVLELHPRSLSPALHHMTLIGSKEFAIDSSSTMPSIHPAMSFHLYHTIVYWHFKPFFEQ